MPRVKGELNTRHMHTAYKAKYNSAVGYSLFRTICEEFNKELSQAILVQAQRITLPFRLGMFYVEKRKVNYNHLKMDYGHYRKTGEKLFHTNRHSDGFQAYIHWRKDVSNVVHKSFYKFTPTRANSRQLAVLMKTPNGHKAYEEYIVPKKA